MKTLMLLFLGFSLAQAKVNSGDAAPDFQLKDQNTKAHKLSDFKGKTVVLEWYNDECPYVQKHYDAKNMQNLQKKYTAQDVVWLSINSSAQGKQGHLTPKTAKAVMKTRGSSPTAILLDADGSVGKLYAAKTTPHMYVIDPTGKLVYQGAIDDQASANPKSIAKANNYVAGVLDKMLAGKTVEPQSTKPYGCSVKY